MEKIIAIRTDSPISTKVCKLGNHESQLYLSEENTKIDNSVDGVPDFLPYHIYKYNTETPYKEGDTVVGFCNGDYKLPTVGTVTKIWEDGGVVVDNLTPLVGEFIFKVVESSDSSLENVSEIDISEINEYVQKMARISQS